LETLRHCLPSSVRRTLDELPESLDETYERILREIKKPNREHARRLLQCLVVATRPLRVQELVEVLAIDFDDSKGIPKLKASWRWEDQEQALFSSCSSLIAIVYSGLSRVVQFSHFSVKEFLTSPRLATPSRDVSHYYIALEPAHAMLAQACIGLLLQLDERVEDGSAKNSSLARYAAEHWVSHAQFKDVSTHLRKEMERLLDPEKPHFALWLKLYNIDTYPKPDSTFFRFAIQHATYVATPLYYAALCGFHDLVKSLIVKYPHHVNAIGGYNKKPLLAALHGEHFQTAQLLRENGADIDARGFKQKTPLHAAASDGSSEVVKKLLEYGADVNARDEDDLTPLFSASAGDIKDLYSVRLLLEQGADVNARTDHRNTPLLNAVIWGGLELVRLLLAHGADARVEDRWGVTPLQAYTLRDSPCDEMLQLLLEYNAK
jgi:ankyrin repeat protein